MGRKRAQMDVTLKLLLDAGDVRPGIGVLHVSTRDQTRHADLNEDGMISFEGMRHRSLSSFAVAAIRSCGAVGRKTANGWQVVSYRGRPLEQYRSDFLEKQSQESDSSRDAEVVNKNIAKKRRVRSALGVKDFWKEEIDDVVRSSDSGGSRVSSTEAAPFKRPPWTKAFAQKRVRPSRTWFDTLPQNSISLISPRSMPPATNLNNGVDATCGMKLTKAAPITRRTPEEEETNAKQNLEVSMWLKKVLNKRHREECGMS